MSLELRAPAHLFRTLTPQGFTSMSEKCRPQEVMLFLNRLFSVWDALLDQFGVYKVETIGEWGAQHPGGHQQRACNRGCLWQSPAGRAWPRATVAGCCRRISGLVPRALGVLSGGEPRCGSPGALGSMAGRSGGLPLAWLLRMA